MNASLNVSFAWQNQSNHSIVGGNETTADRSTLISIAAGNTSSTPVSNKMEVSQFDPDAITFPPRNMMPLDDKEETLHWKFDIVVSSVALAAVLIALVMWLRKRRQVSLSFYSVGGVDYICSCSPSPNTTTRFGPVD
ncbi:unnamed protein product [Aphanomyces euteiches]|uniref:Uncharacterized protein n=1 Tax=Aphanomyces euteiches TaxID=100861 RepID=A0A6G0WID3_9STRA|nr:hypothetical protein Ae201684_014943 [Aphanomyces euteiches]KAH9076361.1 hypothetical protein Ae201684P_010307 [Aphanomyces euteiches]KAH9153740.1 hypothetical protein AeRB84_004064 [Aphanomyces euteiches]